MYPNINLKAIGIVLAVLLTFSSGWYVEHLKFVAYKTQVIALGKVQEQKNKVSIIDKLLKIFGYGKKR